MSSVSILRGQLSTSDDLFTDLGVDNGISPNSSVRFSEGGSETGLTFLILGVFVL